MTEEASRPDDPELAPEPEGETATQAGPEPARGPEVAPKSDGQIGRQAEPLRGAEQPEEASDGEGLTALLEHLRDTRGFDFTGYKRSSLTRGIRKRMDGLHVSGFDAYRRYLDLLDGEFVELFNTILINVTGFFRDPDTWELMSRVVIPRVVSERDNGDPIRAWVPG